MSAIVVLTFCSCLLVSKGLTEMRRDSPGREKRSNNAQKSGKNFIPGCGKTSWIDLLDVPV